MDGSMQSMPQHPVLWRGMSEAVSLPYFTCTVLAMTVLRLSDWKEHRLICGLFMDYENECLKPDELAVLTVPLRYQKNTA